MRNLHNRCRITIDDLKAGVKAAADRVLEETDVLRIFGEETKLTAAKFREKLLDVRQFFRNLPANVLPSSSEAPAELDDDLGDDKSDGADDDLSNESLEPIDAPDVQKAPPPEHDEIDPYAHERKPDYREETKTLIEGASAAYFHFA